MNMLIVAVIGIVACLIIESWLRPRAVRQDALPCRRERGRQEFNS